MKACFKCGVSKPLSEFYAHKKMADGHLNKCKECTKCDSFEHRRSNIEKARAYDRLRGSLPERIADRVARTAEYRAKYPERYKANVAVSNAVRDGRLAKIPCMICGDSKVEGHHPDYSRPLDVVWLCPAHHREIHLSYPDDHYHSQLDAQIATR